MNRMTAWILLFFTITLAPALSAQNDSVPTTTTDPEIAIEDLELLLLPLTNPELAVEAKAWQGLVKEKVHTISMKEIENRHVKKESAKAQEQQSTGVEQAAIAEDTDGHTSALMEELLILRQEKTALIERLQTVIDAMAEKGGDTEELQQYTDAVAGIKVEVTDTNATWIAIKAWAMSAEGGVKWLLLFVKFLLIVALFWVLAKVMGLAVHRMTNRSNRMSELLKNFLQRTVQRAVIFVGIIAALSAVGFNVSALLALVGGGAFIIGFALQGTLANFASGTMLLIYRPFDVGDIVEVGGVSGQVQNVSLVSTTINTFDNKVILVPNQSVWGQVITNATASHQRRVDLEFGISYDDDVDKAKDIIESIVNAHPLVLKEPAPTIELNSLGESSVNFICRPWSATSDYWRLYWDITKQVKLGFDQAGITIPYPQRDIHLRSSASLEEKRARTPNNPIEPDPGGQDEAPLDTAGDEDFVQ